MFRHAHGGIRRDIADGDAHVATGSQIDTVVARCGDADEPQFRQLLQGCASHLDLVGDDDLRACQRRDHFVRGRGGPIIPAQGSGRAIKRGRKT